MQFQGGQLECPAHIKNVELVNLMKRNEEQYEKPVALQRDYRVVSQMHDDLVHKEQHRTSLNRRRKELHSKRIRYMFGLAYFLDQTYSMSNLVIGIDVLSRPRTVRLRAWLEPQWQQKGKASMHVCFCRVWFCAG